MTEDELAAIVRLYKGQYLFRGDSFDRLIAEVRRLWQVEEAARAAAALDLGDDDFLLINLRAALEENAPQVVKAR